MGPTTEPRVIFLVSRAWENLNSFNIAERASLLGFFCFPFPERDRRNEKRKEGIKEEKEEEEEEATVAAAARSNK